MDFQNLFNNELASYITRLTTYGDVHDFSNMFLLTLATLAIATEFFRFTTDKFDPPEHFIAVLFVMAAMMLQKGFIPAMNLIWETGDALGMAFMQEVTGSRDPLFLAKWITRTLSKMSFESISFMHDGVSAIFMAIVIYLVSALLSVIMFLVGIWAVWGLALSKLLGLLFIPCLAYKPTRPFFMTWVQFFLGFVFLMLILRITGSLAALALQSEFMAGSGSSCSGHQLCEVNAQHLSGAASRSRILMTGIISLLMVGSSFKFAHVFSGATSDMGRTAARSLRNQANKLTTKLITRAEPSGQQEKEGKAATASSGISYSSKEAPPSYVQSRMQRTHQRQVSATKARRQAMYSASSPSGKGQGHGLSKGKSNIANVKQYRSSSQSTTSANTKTVHQS
ncbi:type IV secretion system protein [Vibrio algivorus]|uniref:Type IV secretion system protein n=1 Tax=Vibrio algivorus TaxID=1667024 RepID=A0A557PGZ0_9VIBR|nr:type IV secretion system protein [Vibrio algivorus]TVO39927.1 type IV secretion system protein [Vibrio algivorus]